MAKSLYRRIQEVRVKLRQAQRRGDVRKAEELRRERNKLSAEANRLYEINKAKAEKKDAEDWLKRERQKKRDLEAIERKRKQQGKRAKIRRFEKGVGKHGKKAARAFDVSMRSIFLR